MTASYPSCFGAQRLLRPLALALALGLGCASEPPAERVPPTRSGPAASDAQASEGELPRHRRWSTRVGQGGAPRGDADFARLAAEGYRVVLSVDGAAPDTEGAARHGLRYAHVPIGYDGIAREAALQIVKAVREADGAVYVHCHHGKHRGPAAAAVARIACDQVSNEEALSGLLETLSSAYAGLRRDVARFTAPDAAALAAAPPAPERVTPSDLVSHMLEVDDRWAHLQESRDAGWRPDPENPDIDPPHQAMLLVEAFRETARLEDEVARLGPPFGAELRAAEDAAAALERALRVRDHAAADAAAVRVARSCTSCHETVRD